MTEKPYNWKKTHQEYIPGEIDRMVSSLELDPSTATMAKRVHQMAVESEYKHRDADAVASACLFAAVRLQGQAVSLGDVAGVSREEKKTIHTTYRTLCRHLNLSIEPTDFEAFVDRYADELGFGKQAKSLASRLALDAGKSGLEGQMAPKSLAASLVYVVSRNLSLGLTQNDVKEVSGVSAETLRSHYRELADELDVDLGTRRGTSSTDRRESPESISEAVNRLHQQYDIGDDLLADISEILESVDNGRKAVAGRVAGAFWVAVKDRNYPIDVSQSELAYEMGVSDATIENRVREYRDALAEMANG